MDADRIELVAFAILAFAMVAPRLPMYAYLLLTWPFAVGLAPRHFGAIATLLLLGALTPTFYISRYIFGRSDKDPTTWLTLGWDYLAWFAVAGLWLTLVWTQASVERGERTS